MMNIRFAIGAAALCATLPAVPAAAASVGSMTLLTYRDCAGVGSTVGCPTVFPAHQVQDAVFGGGVGVGGATVLDVGGGNKAWTNVTLGAYDLPTITAYTSAPGDARMNANTFAFQSYLNSGTSDLSFSISGNLHIVDSSGSPAGDALLPGGAGYTGYLALWDPHVLDGLSTSRDLYRNLFYADCGTTGVLATGFTYGDLTSTGEQNFGMTTSSCSGGGTINLAAGQEVLVVAGMQIPANRGGFVDASHSFRTTFGKDLTDEQLTAITTNVQSAVSRGSAFQQVVAQVPEPATWTMLIIGFGMVGGAMRRKRTELRYA